MEYFGIVSNEYSGIITRTVGGNVQADIKGC